VLNNIHKKKKKSKKISLLKTRDDYVLISGVSKALLAGGVSIIMRAAH
jgi:hypothetical protein